MAFNRNKYDMDFRNDDTIKPNQIFFDFMQRKFNHLHRLYLDEKCILIDTIIKDQLRKQSAGKIEKLNREKNSRNKRKEGTFKPSPKKACFVNKTTRKSRATSNTSNLKFNTDIPQWSESSSSEEEDIRMSKFRRKSNAEIKNEEVKVSSGEVEEIKIRKCSRKSHVDIINE